MYSIEKTFEFCAAHRLEGHPKCGRLHGHNYAVTVRIFQHRLTTAMILDYNDLTAAVKPIIDQLDHRYIVSDANIAMDDPYAKIAMELGHAFRLDAPASTAECLANYLADEIAKVIKRPLMVAVSETPKTSAAFGEMHE